jgi:hypothetical protein
LIFRYLHFVYSNYKKTLIPAGQGGFLRSAPPERSIREDKKEAVRDEKSGVR